MPSLSTARRILNAKTNCSKTIGQIQKENSDFIMENTWDSDIQSKVGYIYDYMHDDQPNIKDHITYENTIKTRIDVKLIVKSYSSLDQDQPEFYCQFKPSQPLEFNLGDELYYFETEYRQKYGIEFPIGFYVDLPDDKGVYRKWLICEKELGNQFPKYLILPIDYQFMWIEKDGQNIYKRKMWGVNRSQKSYTIGTYTDHVFTRPDNQQKAFLPLNSITESLWYTKDDNKNMRMVVSAKTKHPIIWSLTKIENAKPLGIQVLTFYQNFWNEHTDYIEKDSNGNIIGMWADYFSSQLSPTEPPTLSPNLSSITTNITTSTPTIKVGGSYKNLTINFYNKSNENITTEYSEADFKWSCSMDDEIWTDKVIWRNGAEFNQIKLKIPNDTSIIGKILSIKCDIKLKDNMSLETEILSLELTE